MKEIRQINIEDYNYNLPEDRIAYFPKEKRDESKLLVYRNGEIHDREFKDVADELDSNSLIVFNDSRVIKARLWFHKDTGAVIEVFCLEPTDLEMSQALSSTKELKWNCYIRGAKKWKSGLLKREIEVDGEKVNFSVEKIDRKEDYFIVNFSWDTDHSYSQVLEVAGNIPLPPYIQREAQNKDDERYQTVYSDEEGSVAAPTAGLHFTKDILSNLKEMGVGEEYLTLHVGAGTFKPVNSEEIGNHYMHEEYFEVEVSTIKNILSAKDRKIIAVGTTSVRTLESLYWLGCKISVEKDKELFLGQWDVYEKNWPSLSLEESFEKLISYARSNGLNGIVGSTELIIAPGYKFKVIDGMFTNFHLPKSTLLLLISALVGKKWKGIYNHAIEHEYRFLSYGDSSLLMK